MSRLVRGKRQLAICLTVGWAAVFVGLLVFTPSRAQQMHRDPFESETPTWLKGHADVEYLEKQHIRTNTGARDGQRCEYIHLEAKQGSHIYYQYPVGRAPIDEELLIGMYIKATRPGVKLLARVVLPHERDPKSLDDNLTTYVRGDAYRLVGRWTKLQVPNVPLLLQRQQQLMQAQWKRALNFKDAYVDRILLNVYAGPGRNEVWIDDLHVGPVFKDQPAQNVLPKPRLVGEQPIRPRRNANVEFSGSRLMVNGKRFFIRGIRHTNTPLAVLRRAGFNTVWFPYTSGPQLLSQASNLGFWLVPSFPVTRRTGHLVSRNALSNQIMRFPEADSVLFYDLGGSLVYEQATKVDQSARIIKTVDVGRPVSADVWDGFLPYSRSLDLVGAHRWPLMTDLDLNSYREWLNQRRLLANPNTFMWTWVQNHTPEHLTRLLYKQEPSREFKTPVGPQPAQIRLLTYSALGAGCRGVGFWSDRFLADSHQGRDRLYECALLNKELEMLEPMLLTIDGRPRWVPTSEADVKTVVYRTAKGVLALPMWLGKGAQFVPGQSAATKLEVVVPQVPPGTQCWEITPGEVRSHRTKRVLGGTQVTLPDFGLTTALVFTADIKLIERFQRHGRSSRQLAAQWTFHQAQQEIKKVDLIQQRLGQHGDVSPRAQRLLQQSHARLQNAKNLWDSHLFGEAYREAQRALRPLRILMRQQWESATKMLDTPVAAPFAVSYYTLPQHWHMVSQIRATMPRTNVLAGGDFEVAPDQRQTSWKLESAKLDAVKFRAVRVGKTTPYIKGKTVTPQRGQLCAMLEIQPTDNKTRFGALERTYLALTTRQPARLQPGSLVRVSAWVFIPEPIQASVDGVLFYDSAGGEPLAIRLTKTKEWKKISLYRRVPDNGYLGVTLALSGIGRVFFDDVRIEPLVGETR